jgi:putative glycosyltransferase (TIGR04372 family)
MKQRKLLNQPETIIFSFLNSRNLGDFAEQLLISATVKENLENSKLGVYYENDRPYKQIISSLYSKIDYKMEGNKDSLFPLNIFDMYSGRLILDNPRMEEFGLNRSRIILAGNAFSGNCLPSFDHVPLLRVPEQPKRESERLLQDLGLDPNRWFACFYWREVGFLERAPHPLRDILDPSPYIEAMRFVIDQLGGQVVRLGHPTSTVIPEHPDIINLAAMDNSLVAQIVAISRARFFVSSCSGPLTFGPGFGVPTAATDAIENTSVWNDEDIILTKNIIASNGSRYRQKSALDAGLLATGIAKRLVEPENGFRYVDNNASELKYVAELLHDRTADQQKWREPGSRTNTHPKPQIAFPLIPSLKVDSLVDIPFEPEI